MSSPLDDAFRALVSRERRQLLLALADHHPQRDPSIDCLDDVPFDTGDDIEDIYTRMHHNHLPMLEAAGFIERPEDDRKITIGPNFDVIRPLLQFIDQETEQVGAIDGR